MNHSVMFLNQNLKGFERANSNIRGSLHEPEPTSDMEVSVTRTTTPKEDRQCVERNQIRLPVRPHAIVTLNIMEPVTLRSHLSAGIEPA